MRPPQAPGFVRQDSDEAGVIALKYESFNQFSYSDEAHVENTTKHTIAGVRQHSQIELSGKC